jgi:hypothetical protein
MILEAIRIWTAVLDGEMATTFWRRMVIDAEQRRCADHRPSPNTATASLLGFATSDDHDTNRQGRGVEGG